MFFRNGLILRRPADGFGNSLPAAGRSSTIVIPYRQLNLYGPVPGTMTVKVDRYGQAGDVARIYRHVHR